TRRRCGVPSAVASGVLDDADDGCLVRHASRVTGGLMKILVVDDELGLRHTLSIILTDDGHDVTVGADGSAALAVTAAQTFDLVLCDVRMPGMDGFTFLDRYREQGGQAIAIMMSAYGDDDAAVEAIRRGAYDFIAKPFRADQVLLIVHKAIERER